jgi:hypothetical protein
VQVVAKLAVTLLLPFIVRVIGLADPLASPLQELNVYSEFGVAVNVSTSPVQ